MHLSIKFNRKNFLNLPAEIVFLLYMIVTIGRFLPINTLVLLALIGVIVYKGVAHSRNIKASRTVLCFIAIIIYNTMLLLLNSSVNGLYYFFVQLLSFAFITSFTLGSMDDFYLKRLAKLFNKFFIIFSIVYIFALITGKVSMTDGSFALGIYQVLYGLSFFILYSAKRPILWTFWISLMPFLSGERGLAISLIFVILIYYFIPFISKNKFLYKTFYWLVAFCVTSFQFVYVWLSTTQLGASLNLISSKYTNQNLFSGRQFIWGVMNDYIIESPILGYGLGNEILKQNNIFMSAHNTYVDILLSGGAVSLLLFFYFMYSIWLSMYTNIDEKSIRLSMSFLIAILIFGVNGVIFVGNDMSFTLFIWLIIGIGLMRRNHLNSLSFDLKGGDKR